VVTLGTKVRRLEASLRVPSMALHVRPLVLGSAWLCSRSTDQTAVAEVGAPQALLDGGQREIADGSPCFSAP